MVGTHGGQVAVQVEWGRDEGMSGPGGRPGGPGRVWVRAKSSARVVEAQRLVAALDLKAWAWLHLQGCLPHVGWEGVTFSSWEPVSRRENLGGEFWATCFRGYHMSL